MSTRSTGEIISTLRKEKGLTQKELASKLNVTDKAVSKWERNIAYPDTSTIPALAELLEVSVEELISAKAVSIKPRPSCNKLVNLILKAVAVAMGVSVVVSSLLGTLDTKSGLTLLGIGITCVGVYLLKND